jgi:23S rRNA pseudouridine1911/1915/1917 synthase
VLICGRGLQASRTLKLAFRQRQVEKSYLALTLGRVERDEFTIDLPMRLTEDVRVVMEIHSDGLASATEVRVLRRGLLKSDGTAVSMVECRPRTGRQHQIRVHLQAMGHPIIGDKIYNGDVGRFLRFCRNEQTDEDRAALRIGRHALHAWKIALPHPATGIRHAFSAPLAPDLQRFADEQIEWNEVAADA